MEMIDETQRESFKRRVELAKRHSSSFNGPQCMLHGLTFAAIYLTNAFIRPGYINIICTLGCVTLWLIGKEYLKKKPYDRFGKAQEKLPWVWNICHKVNVVLLAVLSLISWLYRIFFVTASLQSLLILLVLTAYPVIVGKFCRPPHDFPISMLLFYVCIYSIAGQQYSFLDQLQLIYGLTGLIFLLLGAVSDWDSFQDAPKGGLRSVLN
jgi:membrane protein YqaA with SNARE-associated domain